MSDEAKALELADKIEKRGLCNICDFPDFYDSREREVAVPDPNYQRELIVKALREYASEIATSTNAGPQAPGSCASTGSDGEGAVSRSRADEPLSPLNRVAEPVDGHPSAERAHLAPPTANEIACYRDIFRAELDKRMDTKHPSASPSTEAHGVALRLFIDRRNGEHASAIQDKSVQGPVLDVSDVQLLRNIANCIGYLHNADYGTVLANIGTLQRDLGRKLFALIQRAEREYVEAGHQEAESWGNCL